MICENCGKKQATRQYKAIINNSIHSISLCDECCAKLGYNSVFGFNDSFGPKYNIEDFLKGFTVQPGVYVKDKEAGINSNSVCPLCKTSISEIWQSGRVGCADCYEVFRDQLRPFIKQIHGSVKHTGRVPKNAEISLEYRLKRLSSELNEAVINQEYEKAAVIRDEIKKIREEA